MSVVEVGHLTTAAILTRAAVLVAAGWTQGTSALDRAGNRVSGSGYTAVSHDAGDAIFTAAGTNDVAVLRPCFQAMTRVIGSPDLVGWNDTPGRTQAEVVAALKAAAKAEAELAR
jgi:hypothetical protein